MPKPITGSAPNRALTCSSTGTGIGVPPEMQMRSVLVSKSATLRVLQHRDQHRRHAVQDRRAFLVDELQQLQRIEVDRLDERAAVRQQAQHVEHIAGGVEEGHGGDHAVAGAKPGALAEQPRVVDRAAVRDHRALGRAGGAAGELDLRDIVRAAPQPGGRAAWRPATDLPSSST